MTIEQSKTTAAEVGRLALELLTRAKAAAQEQTDLCNLARQIGLLSRHWCNHQNLAIRFYESRRDELPASVSYGALKACIVVTRRLEAAAESVEETRATWQPLLVGLGAMPAPRRQAKHTRIQPSRHMRLIQRVGLVRQHVAEWLRDQPVNGWKPGDKLAAKAQLKAIVDFYDQL